MYIDSQTTSFETLKYVYQFCFAVYRIDNRVKKKNSDICNLLVTNAVVKHENLKIYMLGPKPGYG